MTNPTPPLFTPDELEQACIEILGAHHPRHLAALERQTGRPARSIERLKTIDLLADDGDWRSLDELPCLLLACNQLAEAPQSGYAGAATVFHTAWELELQVLVMGGGRDVRADAMRRARWYTLTAIECLSRRLPYFDSLSQTVQTVDPTSIRFGTATGDDGPQLLRGEALLTVVVNDAITGKGGPLLLEFDDQYVPPTQVQVLDASADVEIEPIVPDA